MKRDLAIAYNYEVFTYMRLKMRINSGSAQQREEKGESRKRMRETEMRIDNVSEDDFYFLHKQT